MRYIMEFVVGVLSLLLLVFIIEGGHEFLSWLGQTHWGAVFGTAFILIVGRIYGSVVRSSF